MIPSKLAESSQSNHSAIARANLSHWISASDQSCCNTHSHTRHDSTFKGGMQFNTEKFTNTNRYHREKGKPLFAEASTETYDRLEKSNGATIVLIGNLASLHYVTDNILTGDYSGYQNTACTNNAPIPQSPLSTCKV